MGEKFGKLGHHSEKTLDEDKICTYPKYVEGDLKKKVVVAVAAGLSHSVAVTDEGHLYTWGSNEYGQLGHTSRSGQSKYGAANNGTRKKSNSLSSSFEKSNGTMKQLNFFRNRSSSKVKTILLLESPNMAKKQAKLKYGPCQHELLLCLYQSGMVDRGKWPKSQLMRLVRVQYSVLDVFGSGVIASPQPTRVSFPGTEELRRANGLSTSPNGMYVIPRQTRIMDVACTRNHNVAVSTSGEVYTWCSSISFHQKLPQN